MIFEECEIFFKKYNWGKNFIFSRNATVVKFKTALDDRLNWAELKLIAMIIFLPILGTLLTENGFNEYKMDTLNVYNKISNAFPSKEYTKLIFFFSAEVHLCGDQWL